MNPNERIKELEEENRRLKLALNLIEGIIINDKSKRFNASASKPSEKVPNRGVKII